MKETVKMTLPPDFVARTKALLGDEYPLFETALQQETPVSIRINRSKAPNEPALSKVAWSDTGYYLPERIAFTFDPVFHAGGYYVQEASSMFLEQAVRQYVDGAVTCLDLCAAPGGKSTHLSGLLPEGSLLVSNEIVRSRSFILAENMAKWGNPASIVTNNSPEDLGRFTGLFDMIVTDVPCSGEGMFRKDPESMGEWSVGNVNGCASRQCEIIHDIWNALKPGGILIYSTCTYNTEENEENIRYIAEVLGAEVLPVTVNDEWKITGPLKYNYPVYRFFPHKTKGEGFFLAVLRKAADDEPQQSYKRKKEKKGRKPVLTFPSAMKEWVESIEDYAIENYNDTFFAIPAAHEETFHTLRDKLRIIQAGIRLGEIKGKDCIPSQQLALSAAINRKAFPIHKLNWEQAIAYLKKEPLLLPEGIEKGYILLSFEDRALGFVKNLGNRSNNLYPQEWRIRSGYMPSTQSSLF